MNRNKAVTDLVQYAVNCGLSVPEDRSYLINRLLEVLQADVLEETDVTESAGDPELADILETLLEDALSRGVIPEDTVTYRDLFDTKLMGCLLPAPSIVAERFRRLYEESGSHRDRKPGAKAATDYFYKFCGDADYIRRYRIEKDKKWKFSCEYGELDITINLSKPEKDPKAIAAAKNLKQSGYPKCQLCRENEGYAGRVNHPARQNLRLIPVKLGEETWFFQYSPYVYYNEHCILLKGTHDPMHIEAATFHRLFEFVKQFPHYFLGSNADLPIVGGSILTHDHFQGGCYEFAMERAGFVRKVSIRGYEDVEAGIVKWPMSVLRIRHTDTERLAVLAEHILETWRGYSDKEAFVYAQTEGEPHNTVTPIARFRDGAYELDLVLRNNITTEEHPLGVFHPHSELHHIKKENIGLIEVMGLAVLPARLLDEMEIVKKCILGGKDIKDQLALLRGNEEAEKHADWVEEILARRGEISSEDADSVIEEEIGRVFVKVLEDSGVFKQNGVGLEQFIRFIEVL